MTPQRWSKKVEIDVLPVHCQSSNDLLLDGYMKRVDILSISYFRYTTPIKYKFRC